MKTNPLLIQPTSEAKSKFGTTLEVKRWKEKDHPENHMALEIKMSHSIINLSIITTRVTDQKVTINQTMTTPQVTSTIEATVTMAVKRESNNNRSNMATPMDAKDSLTIQT